MSIEFGQKLDRIIRRERPLTPLISTLCANIEPLIHRPPTELIRSATAPERHLVTPYCSWETVRRTPRNPALDDTIATGFEGYLVGMYDDPRFAVRHLIESGKEVLMAAREEFGSDAKKIEELLAGNGSKFSPQALANAVEMFLALRDILCIDSDKENLTEQRKAFRDETVRFAENEGKIIITPVKDGVQQVIILPKADSRAPKLTPAQLDELLRDSRDRNVWQLVASIGQVGHPIVRRFLDEFIRNQGVEDCSTYQPQLDIDRYALVRARMACRKKGIRELPPIPLKLSWNDKD